MSPLGFGKRIRQAMLDHASQIGRRYTNAELARDAGEADRGEPYSAQLVTEWFSERSEPTLGAFRAIGYVLGKEPAWLMALDEPWEPATKKHQPAQRFPAEKLRPGKRLPKRRRA